MHPERGPTASRTALGSSELPIQWAIGDLSPGVKRPGRETEHSHEPSAGVRTCGAVPPLSIRRHG
jgi:hypothetical protein